ncbi:MAG: hypothetical protein LBB67_06675 [Oscillospiraceae bacterium]|nr:hypothetical protein [Oscillospiraceae bacterium]
MPQKRSANERVLEKVENQLRRLGNTNRQVLSFALILMLMIMAVWTMGTISKQNKKTEQYRQKTIEAQQQYDALDALNKSDQAFLASDDKETFEAYVIRVAHEELRLSLQGEQVFVDVVADTP